MDRKRMRKSTADKSNESENASECPIAKRPKYSEQKKDVQKPKGQVSAVIHGNSDNQVEAKVAKILVPAGTPGCLAGMTFAQTGTLQCMKRADFSKYIAHLGALETSGITKQTTHLVYGEKAGAGKLNKSRGSGTIVMSEAELFDYIRSQSENPNEEYVYTSYALGNEKESKATTTTTSQEKPLATVPKKKTKPTLSATSASTKAGKKSSLVDKKKKKPVSCKVKENGNNIDLKDNKAKKHDNKDADKKEKKVKTDSSVPSVPVCEVECLKGMSFAQTGTLKCMPRALFSKYLKDLGASETSTVTKQTTHLVYGDKAGKVKLTKAREAGITIYSETEFFNFVGTLSSCFSSDVNDTAASKPSGKADAKQSSMKGKKLIDSVSAKKPTAAKKS